MSGKSKSAAGSIFLTSLVAVTDMFGACTPSSPWKSQEEVATAVRAELRTLIPLVGKDVTDYDEGLRMCGAILDGSQNFVYIRLRFAPDDSLMSQMATGYLAEKQSQGWKVTTDPTATEPKVVLVAPHGLSFMYESGRSPSSMADGRGPCMPKSAGTPSSQGWVG